MAAKKETAEQKLLKIIESQEGPKPQGEANAQAASAAAL